MANTTWIEFIEIPNEGKKTKVWTVHTKDGGDVLGRIGWFPSWRGYAFGPRIDRHTFFERTCLRDIADFIEQQNKLHRESRKKK